MKKISILCFSMLLSVAIFGAEDPTVRAILQSVEMNNAQLKSARQQNAAAIAELKTGNALGETSVEYTPFYQSGVSGTASSELIVSQEFDFPTVYSERRKDVSLQQNVLDSQYLIARRDVLFRAKILCLDINLKYQLDALYASRLAVSDSLLMVFERRLQHGDATILDVNRIKMERMALLKDSKRNEGEVQVLMVELQGVNGGEPVSPALIEALKRPLVIDDTPVSADSFAEVAAAEASVKASEHDVRLSRQAWMPKLTLGYRRNTELREAMNGVLVGVSVPLFGNGAKVKAARLREEVARQELESVRQEVTGKQRSLQTEAISLQQLLQVYDADLLQQNLRLLQRAVQAGELSIAEYYTEAARVYETMQDHILTTAQYHKVLAEINSNSL